MKYRNVRAALKSKSIRIVVLIAYELQVFAFWFCNAPLLSSFFAHPTHIINTHTHTEIFSFTFHIIVLLLLLYNLPQWRGAVLRSIVDNPFYCNVDVFEDRWCFNCCCLKRTTKAILVMCAFYSRRKRPAHLLVLFLIIINIFNRTTYFSCHQQFRLENFE